MKTSEDTVDTGSDDALRASMQRALASTTSPGLEGLQARAMAEWRAHMRADPSLSLGATAGWRAHPRRWGLAVLALAVAGLLLLKAAPDPAQDELLQPDVLSLISLGEL